MPTFAITCACNKNVKVWKKQAELSLTQAHDLRLSCHQHATTRGSGLKRCWEGSDTDLWGHILRIPIEIWPDMPMAAEDSGARSRSRSPRRDEPPHQPRYSSIVPRYQAKPRSPVRPPGTAQLPPRPPGSWELSRLRHHNDDDVQGLQYLTQLTLESHSMMQQLLQQNQQLFEQLRRERHNDDRHHDDDDRRVNDDGERHRDNDRHRYRSFWG